MIAHIAAPPQAAPAGAAGPQYPPYADPGPGLEPAVARQAASGDAEAPESVNAVFARITSGHARPGDFAHYVDMWDKLQQALTRRTPQA